MTPGSSREKETTPRIQTVWFAVPTPVRSAVRPAIRAARQAGWSFVRKRRIRRYLRGKHPRKLQIGAGSNPLEGWLNTDVAPKHGVVFMDARKRFPFPDETFDYVFSEHAIEHLPHEGGRAMLRESNRVLKRGGTIRVATPDLSSILSLGTGHRTPLQERYLRWLIDNFMPEADDYDVAFAINNFFWKFGHRFVYDAKSLRGALESAGFSEVVEFSPGESDDPALAGIEAHGRFIGDEEMNRFETMVLQARRATTTGPVEASEAGTVRRGSAPGGRVRQRPPLR